MKKVIVLNDALPIFGKIFQITSESDKGWHVVDAVGQEGFIFKEDGMVVEEYAKQFLLNNYFKTTPMPERELWYKAEGTLMGISAVRIMTLMLETIAAPSQL